MNLARSHEFVFTTPALKLERVSPSAGSRINYKPRFRLRFNYPVAQADLKRHLAFFSGGRRVRARITYPYLKRKQNEFGQKISVRDARRTLDAIPERTLGRDVVVRLVLSEDLTALKGNRPLGKAIERKFKTYGPLEVRLQGKPKFFDRYGGHFIRFNNPVKRLKAISALRLQPAARYRGSKGGKITSMYLSNWDVKPGQTYKIQIAAGLKDAYGNSLRGKRDFEIRIPDYRPAYRMDSGHGVLEAKMEQRLRLRAVNLENVKLRISGISKDDILDELKDFRNQIKGENPQDLLVKTGLAKNQPGSVYFDLKKYLNPERRGWLRLGFAADVPDYSGKKTITRKFVRYVQSTDLGMTVKLGSKRAHVWVSSLDQGNALKSIRIKVFDPEGEVGDCITDQEGYCAAKLKRFPLKALVTAEAPGNARDRAFVATKHNTVYMYRLTSFYDAEACRPAMKGQVVYDRRLYRPGDQVAFKVVLNLRREGKAMPFPKGEDVKVLIRDAKGQEIYKKTLESSALGGVWDKIPLKKEAAVGHYNIEISPASKEIRGTLYDTFQVEEFRPVGFTVGIEGTRMAKVGEKVPLKVKARYLFGAPMQKAPLNYTVTRSGFNPSFHKYSGFLFGDRSGYYYDPDGNQDFSRYLTGGEGRLNAQGELDFKINLTPMGRKGGKSGRARSQAYSAAVEARVRDRDDKTVTHKKNLQVYAGNILPGIRSKSSFEHYKKPFAFDLVAVNNKGENPGSVSVELSIIKEEWKSIYTRGPSGSRQLKNTLMRKVVKKEILQLSGKSREYVFSPRTPGTYVLDLQEAKGLSYSSVRVYAYGGDALGWNFNDDDVVTVTADKEEYQPGDTAKIMVQSPFKSARAILTVEREKVLFRKVVEIKGSGEPLLIPIKKEYLPNVYVGIMILQPRKRGLKPVPGNEDPGLPVFKTGMANLRVSSRSERTPLNIKTDREDYGPGDEVIINLRSAPGAEIALSVADRGVLDLINYHYPDPIAKFFSNWPLGVQILENRGNLIHQYVISQKGITPGGGEQDQAGVGGFPHDSEDGTRRDFRYTAYWNPALRADKSGKLRVKFKLPHNLTTFRISAMSAAKSGYARAEKEFRVRKKLVLRPVVPRFIRPGDALELGAVVVNQLGRRAKLEVSLNSSLLGGPQKREISLGVDESREVIFQTSLDAKSYYSLKRKAKKEIRVSGSLSAKVKNGSGSRDKVVFNFPVRESPIKEAVRIAGFTEERVEEGIRLPPEKSILGDSMGLELEFSSTALTGLRHAFRFYDTNPYFCMEQRASAFMVNMAAGKLFANFENPPAGARSYDFEKSQEFFTNELKSHQNADGGFSLWKTDLRVSNPYLTAYVVFVLQVADELNEKRDEGIYSHALEYLENYIKRPPPDGLSYVLESYSLIYYVLAREGRDAELLEKFLLKNEGKLSMRARGHLALGITFRRGIKDYRKDPDLNRLVGDFLNRLDVRTHRVTIREAGGAYRRAFYSDGALQGVVLRLLMKTDRENPLIPGMVRFLLEDGKNRFWMDSHSAGNLAYALYQYRKLYEGESKGEIQANLTLKGHEVKQILQSGKREIARSRIGQEQLYKNVEPGKTLPLVIKKTGKGRLYYSALLRYAPVLKDAKPRDEGIEIRRAVFSMSEPGPGGRGLKKVSRMKRGSLYLVRYRVVNPKAAYNFMLEAPLASQLEPVNTRFAVEGALLGKYLEKKRNESTPWWAQGNLEYEYRDDRVLIKQNYLSPGMHEFSYVVRPVLRGVAEAPAARAFLMYEPEVFGRTGQGRQVVK